MSTKEGRTRSVPYFKESWVHIKHRVGLLSEKTTYPDFKRFQALYDDLKKHHRDTYFHSGRVFYFTSDVLSYLDDESNFIRQSSITRPFTKERIERVKTGSLGHDFGKLAYSRRVLDSDREEFAAFYAEAMKEHPRISYNYLKEIGGRSWLGVAVVAKLHHQFTTREAYFSEAELEQTFQEAILEGYDPVELKEDGLILNIVDVYDSILRRESLERKGVQLEMLVDPNNGYLQSELNKTFAGHQGLINNLFEDGILLSAILPPIEEDRKELIMLA